MKKYICLVFARHTDNPKPFLFCVEPITDIRDGAKLYVQTMRGDSEATAIGNSFIVDERALDAIVKANGAYLPLKRVIGAVQYELVRKRNIVPLDSSNLLI